MKGKMSPIKWTVAMAIILLCPSFARATIGPIGPEIQVNETTAGDQALPAASMDDAGNFVVVWQSENLSPTCATGDTFVMARVYNADGTPRTGEFQVNTTPVVYSDFPLPDVAMDSNGDFVVVWKAGLSVSPCLSGCPPPCPDDYPDGSGTAILGRRFNLDGVAQGTEFVVNQNPAQDQLTPSVGIDTAGNFTVAWQTTNYTTLPLGASDIWMRRFAADGTPLTGDIMVNAPLADPAMQRPNISMNRTGRYVVGWTNCTTLVCGDSDIFGKVYDQTGNQVGSEFMINTYTTNLQDMVDIAMRNDGTFVASWGSQGQDGSWSGTYAQQFDNIGNKVGLETQVNTTTFFDQGSGDVALALNTFLVFFTDLRVPSSKLI